MTAPAAGARPRVVVVTTFFPSPRDPYRTPFIPNLLRAMADEVDLHLVIPVARRPWREATPVPDRETHAGFTVAHPRYLAIPGLHPLSGLTYFFGVWRVLKRLRRELGPIVLHAHCAYPDAVGVALAARLLRLPFVATVHGSDINVSARQAALRPQIRWALRAARQVIAVSGALRDNVLKLGGMSPGRISTIPCSGYSPDVFHPIDGNERISRRISLDIPPQIPLVVFVGHLIPIKGLDHLIRAWVEVSRRRPDARLVLIGEGGERALLEALVLAEGLTEQVAFLGPLPQRDVAAWISIADSLCLPSHAEGSPNVIVEALASGIPVVASAVGGIPDLVKNGVNGLLIPPADPHALAHALIQVLDNSTSAAAIAASVDHLTWTALAARNRDILRATALEEPCAH